MAIACGLLLGSAIGQQCATQSNLAEETDRLLQTDRDFSSYSAQTNPAEAFNKYLDEEALQLPHLGVPILGRESIYEGMQGGNYALIWEPVTGLVSQAGDLGYTWGNWEASFPSAEGDTVRQYGKYLNVWRKQADESWKVLVDMGNSNPPPNE